MNLDGSETVTISKGEPPIVDLDIGSLVEKVMGSIDTDALATEVLKRIRESGELADVDPAEFVAELLATAGE